MPIEGRDRQLLRTGLVYLVHKGWQSFWQVKKDKMHSVIATYKEEFDCRCVCRCGKCVAMASPFKQRKNGIKTILQSVHALACHNFLYNCIPFGIVANLIQCHMSYVSSVYCSQCYLHCRLPFFQQNP